MNGAIALLAILLHGVDREHFMCFCTFLNMMLIKESKLMFQIDTTGKIQLTGTKDLQIFVHNKC
jgi:hypothetical protein